MSSNTVRNTAEGPEQSLAELQKFRQEGRLSIDEGPVGYFKISLFHPSGSSATLYSYGAHLTSFVADNKEVLYLSKRAIFARGTALRGGIPICWPQFSGRGSLPAHGFARSSVWQLKSSGISASGQTVVTLRLSENEQTRALWPQSFCLEYEVALGKDLQLSLKVTNTDTKDCSYTCALHTYFQIASIAATEVEGLAGLTLTDFLTANTQSIEDRKSLIVSGPTDRCYLRAPSTLKILDRNNLRTIQLTSQNFPDAVLWNPWEERSKQIKDLGADDYLQFICLENGVVEQPYQLAAGKEVTHKLSIEVR